MSADAPPMHGVGNEEVVAYWRDRADRLAAKVAACESLHTQMVGKIDADWDDNWSPCLLAVGEWANKLAEILYPEAVRATRAALADPTEAT